MEQPYTEWHIPRRRRNRGSYGRMGQYTWLYLPEGKGAYNGDRSPSGLFPVTYEDAILHYQLLAKKPWMFPDESETFAGIPAIQYRLLFQSRIAYGRLSNATWRRLGPF